MSRCTSPLRCACLLGVLLLLVVGTAAPTHAEDLVASGLPAPGQVMTLHVTGSPGAPILLVMGLGFLDTPVMHQGKPFHIDTGLPWFLLPLGNLPAGGAADIPMPIPNSPVFVGTLAHCQVAAPSLSAPTTIWLREPDQTVAPAPAGSHFGTYIAAADLDTDGNDDLVIGAVDGAAGAGEVYVAFGPAPTPTLILSDPTPQRGARFGAVLALGNVLGGPELDIVVSAPGSGVLSADDTGEVWIYPGPSFTSATLLPSPTGEVGAGFGTALSIGDFDGDGVKDLAVGAPGATHAGFFRAGLVHVFHGGSLAPQITLADPTPETAGVFGATLAPAADLDLDGRADLVVGSPNATVSTIPGAGEAWVHHGPLTAAPIRLTDPHPSPTAAFACRLKTADLIGDSRPDVLVGTPGGAGTPSGNPSGIPMPGEVHLFDAGLPGAALVIEDPTPEFFQHFGMDVHSGDVNGDGHVDLVLSAFLADLGPATDAGEVFVYLGPDWAVRVEITAPTPESNAQFGVFTVLADLDGDGRQELVVAAPRAKPGGLSEAGSVTVVTLP